MITPQQDQSQQTNQESNSQPTILTNNRDEENQSQRNKEVYGYEIQQGNYREPVPREEIQTQPSKEEAKINYRCYA
jgi:hypothetical protein